MLLYRYLYNNILYYTFLINLLLNIPTEKYYDVYTAMTRRICRFVNVFIVFIVYKHGISKNTIENVNLCKLECLINFQDNARK